MRVECQAEAAGLRYVLYKEAEPIGQALLADGCLAGAGGQPPCCGAGATAATW